jgi:pimeloyl-ACP methyl ester carboxylesterase
MKEQISTRELITLDVLGSVVRGTYHMAFEPIAESQSSPSDGKRVGVLFLSSLASTRAATGDSAVYWADSFATLGYPCFRLDMPGFGDSDGNPPPELLKFINTGGYGSIASCMIEQLAKRFCLSGLVVAGLCAGAVSALYTAAASEQCRGLVLMDPYFHLPVPDSSWIWQKLTGRISRTALGRCISDAYGHSVDLCNYLRRNRMPENTNFALLKCWKAVASTGLPILLFKAPSITARGEDFDYLKYILENAGIDSRVMLKPIDGAGHTFSNRVGRSAVRQHTEEWLTACFPLNASEKFESLSVVSPAPAPITNTTFQLDCLHQ